MRMILPSLALLAVAGSGTALELLPTITVRHEAPSPLPAVRTEQVEPVHAVRVYQALGAPRGFAIVFSDKGGWSAANDAFASQLARRGIGSAAVDSEEFLAAMDRRQGNCVHPVQPLLALARTTEIGLGWPMPVKPMLIGSGLGGTIAYAALAQGVPGVFAAGVSRDMDGALTGKRPWCRVNGFTATRVRHPIAAWQPGATTHMPAPWIVLDSGAPRPIDDALVGATPNSQIIRSTNPVEDIDSAVLHG